LESQLQEEIRFLILENLELREKAEQAQQELHALQDDHQSLQEANRARVESEHNHHLAALAPTSSVALVARGGSDSLPSKAPVSSTDLAVSSFGPETQAAMSPNTAVLGILQLADTDVSFLVRDLFFQADHNALMVGF
jgi:hypothetical protein